MKQLQFFNSYLLSFDNFINYMFYFYNKFSLILTSENFSYRIVSYKIENTNVRVNNLIR